MDYRRHLTQAFAILAITLPAALATTVPPHPVLVRVTNAIPNTQLDKAFISLRGWTGGDAAYSVPLNDRRSLWLFGDTFIGEIAKGFRKKADMVHNTAGWLDLRETGTAKMRYFWRHINGAPGALVQPEGSGKSYYWPSGMAMAGRKLALFCKVVVDRPEDKSGFGFSWTGQELVLVDNPNEEPTSWKYKSYQLPGGESSILPGAACMVDGDYVYVYSTLKVPGAHPSVLMRIPAVDLACADMSKFEYWTHKVSEAGEVQQVANWSPYPLYPITLFEQGAPELSVSRIAGLPGYWAVFTENGLGPNIVMRHADKPEGPWSNAIIVYQCPEAVRDPKLLCYGAKHHPELASEDRTLVVTYCLNPGPISAHRTQPMTYFPKAVTIRLAPSE